MQNQTQNQAQNQITVVIPTYNSMMLLKETLDSFKKQTLNSNEFEIIVVDDGSKDGTRFLVDEYREALDISYYYLEDKGFRLSAARNVGIHYAKYPLLLVFDCGMLASEQLLTEHIKAHENHNNNVVIGLSYGVEEFTMENAAALTDIMQNNDLRRTFALLKNSPQFFDCRYHSCKAVNFDLSQTLSPWVMCWGGHISAKTQLLRDIGSFDEWFNTWGGEDVDLAIRLHQHGGQFTILPGCEAIHMPHFRCEDSNKQSSQQNIQYIIAKHQVPGVAMLADYGWQAIFDARLDELACA